MTLSFKRKGLQGKIDFHHVEKISIAASELATITFPVEKTKFSSVQPESVGKTFYSQSLDNIMIYGTIFLCDKNYSTFLQHRIYVRQSDHALVCVLRGKFFRHNLKSPPWKDYLDNFLIKEGREGRCVTIDQTMKDEFFFFMNFVPKTIFGGMRKFQPEGSKESDPFDGSEAIAWSVNRQDPCLALKWTREPKPSILKGIHHVLCSIL